MYKICFILLFLFSFLDAKLNITVTYPFQKKFIEKIAPNTFSINVIFNKKVNMEELKVVQQNKFFYSDIYFTLGLKEEDRYIRKFKSKNHEIKIVNISKNIKKDIVNGKENPYIWLDPLLVRKMVKNIYNQLIKIQVKKKSFFKNNLDLYLNELDDVFLDLKSKIDPSTFINFYVYEPCWYYYAKRFGLNLYHRKNKIMFANEIRESLLESRKYNIKKILISRQGPVEIAKSLSAQINSRLIINDIYAYHWKVNIYKLTREIVSFNSTNNENTEN